MADPALTQLVTALQSRPWRRRFLPPLAEAALAAFEVRLGCQLPPVMRSFYLELCAGEEDRGYLGILTLERGVANASRSVLPGVPAAEASVILLPVRERDDGPFEAVVCGGRYADTIWLWDGAAVSPLAGPDGQPTPALDLLRDALDEALQGMPAPLGVPTTIVDLAGLDLDAAPPELARAVHAVDVSIGGNRLTELPDAVRSMAGLQRLAASDNRLAQLPSWLGDLPLHWLDVSRNQLQAIPPSLRKLDRLEYLAADGNLLKTLATDGLDALQELTVAGNRIERIDGAPPPKLRSIDVGNNQLMVLPSWLGELSDLQVMKLAGNPLGALPSTLEGAEFAVIEIGALPPRDAIGAQPTWDWALIFELLGSCKIDWLRVAGSPLPALPDSARSLQRVRRLAIQSAALETVPDFIGELAELEALWLDDNRLTTLPPSLARHPRLRNIVLFGNPIARDELDRMRTAMPHITIDA